MLETFLQDLRYGLRSLRQNRGIAVIAVLSLGLAIGANTTVFTWMDRFVLQPLPGVTATSRLVTVNTQGPGGAEWSVSLPALRDWRAAATTMDLSGYAFTQKLGAYMLTGFGVLALLLSAIGIYGVMSYAVSRRTREIGVRVALGAARRDVIGLVVGRAMRLASVGLVVGAAAALGAGQLLQSQLFGVSPRDPATFASIVLLLGCVAFLASWLPARRAAAVDPLVALRYE